MDLFTLVNFHRIIILSIDVCRVLFVQSKRKKNLLFTFAFSPFFSIFSNCLLYLLSYLVDVVSQFSSWFFSCSVCIKSAPNTKVIGSEKKIIQTQQTAQRENHAKSSKDLYVVEMKERDILLIISCNDCIYIAFDWLGLSIYYCFAKRITAVAISRSTSNKYSFSLTINYISYTWNSKSNSNNFIHLNDETQNRKRTVSNVLRYIQIFS